MNIGGVFNADMATVRGWLAEGFEWWLGELRQLVPVRWQQTLTRSLPLAVPGGAPGLPYRLLRDGREVTWRRGRRVTLGLDDAVVLVTSVPVPPSVGPTPLRRMLALEIGRSTPMRGDAVFHDVRRDTPTSASLAIVRREDAHAALAEAATAGLVPVRLGTATGFDFLPAMRAAGDAQRGGGMSAWAAVALLAVAVLIAAIMRDAAEVRAVRTAVEGQSAGVAVADALRERVGRERMRRAVLAARRADAEPLAVLDAVTGVLPPGAWVQRYAWQPRTVRLIGFKTGGIDLGQTLRRAPMLRNVRASTSDIPAALSSGEPFDVTADIVGTRR